MNEFEKGFNNAIEYIEAIARTLDTIDLKEESKFHTLFVTLGQIKIETKEQQETETQDEEQEM